MISFLHPQFLWLLLLVPVLAWLRGRGGRSAAVRYSSVEVLKQIGRVRRKAPGRWMNALRLLALAALVVALARPRLGNEHTEIDASGIDIMLAVDVSSSMEAMDFTLDGKQVNRIDAVKDVVSQFVKDRPSDRIGLVAFAGKPYLMCPLTLDHDLLLKRLEEIALGQVEDGTAIGSATVIGHRLGCQTPCQAEGQEQDIGIADRRNEQRGHRRRLVMAKVDIDETTLKRMSEMTGGKYFRATDTDSLEKIYGIINQLEKTKRKVRHFSDYREMFAWALIPALFFLAMEIALGATRYRRVP